MATLSTTLAPTVALVRRKAAEAGKNIEIVECLCEGAFEAVMAADTATHDRIVGDALTKRMQGVDVIVLAQASMARVLETLPRAQSARRACESGAGCAAHAGYPRCLRKRYFVVGLLGVVSVITFLDRMAIAVVGPLIQGELHLTPRSGVGCSAPM